VALSRWIALHAINNTTATTNSNSIINTTNTAIPTTQKTNTILELGAGCGLTGLVAAQFFPTAQVTLTDFNSIVLENLNRNIHGNHLQDRVSSVGLDFYVQNPNHTGWIDTKGHSQDPVDLLLGADIICQPSDAFAVARTIHCALKPKGRAVLICGDSNHRFGVEQLEDACIELGLRVEMQNVKDLHGGRLLEKDMEKTSGYVDGMVLTMYMVTKKEV